MPNSWIIILLHQVLFQGMFVAKNMALKSKTTTQIRGKNREATVSITFFAFFIGISLLMACLTRSFGKVDLMDNQIAMVLGIMLLWVNLIISAASLITMKDSWRVGVLENQKTELITRGIYGVTRNPYFVSYILMFVAYTILLQNFILFGLSAAGCILIHKMILKEEKYLHRSHGNAYLQYASKVPRYLLL